MPQIKKTGDFYYKADIIAAFREAHEDTYDYSLLPEKVKNKDAKVPIICHHKNILGEEHGVFEQSIIRHLSGRNCPKCKMKNTTYSDAEIIAMAQQVHGDTYEYINITREGSRPMIHAICHEKDEMGNEHGEFCQSMAHHIKGGQGCPKCRYIKSAASNRKNLSEWIKLATEVHGGIYDYSLITNYKNDRTAYPMLCKKHNSVFYRTFNAHIQAKQGCPICGREKCAESRRYTQEEWIKLAIERHGDKYGYEKVVYQGSQVPVEIYCKKHRVYFKQMPTNHLFGQGCPICKESKLEIEISNFLTASKIVFERQTTFEWLKNSRNMFLDFYLPEYNIAIECQGKQHFNNGGWTNDNNDYVEIERRDFLKRQLCEEHGIKILYYSNLGIEYPYTVFENKEELLTEIRKKGE